MVARFSGLKEQRVIVSQEALEYLNEFHSSSIFLPEKEVFFTFISSKL